MHAIEFRAMNCQMAAMIDTHTPAAKEMLAQVPRWFNEWEKCLSRFIADSELSRINAAGSHDWVRVSDVLWDVLRDAHAAARWSEGLVTPLVGAAVRAAGYDRSFEQIQMQPALDGITLALAWNTSPASGLMHDSTRGSARDFELGLGLEMDVVKQAVRLPPGARLDLGGFAKGWAAHEIVERLRPYGPALVDAGGDIAASPLRHGAKWPIGIANPHDSDAASASPWVLNMHQGGIATSGRDYRRWQSQDGWQHHIIDPRSGRPAQTDVLTATVIAPDTLSAEVAAKVALILGSEDGLHWIDRREGLAALLILEDGQALPSAQLEEYLW